MSISRGLQFEVWKKSEGICWYCGIQTVFPSRTYFNHGNVFSVEHVIPQVHGGTDDIENLVPACKTCNSTKRTGSLERFRYLLGNPKVRFSPEQIAYLRECGFELPNYSTYVFWFERKGHE